MQRPRVFRLFFVLSWGLRAEKSQPAVNGEGARVGTTGVGDEVNRTGPGAVHLRNSDTPTFGRKPAIAGPQVDLDVRFPVIATPRWLSRRVGLSRQRGCAGRRRRSCGASS